MAGRALDQLLTTLDVRLHAFAVCEVRHGYRLVFNPMNAVVVHYVLAGEGVVEVKGSKPIGFGPGSMLIVPPGTGQSLRAGDAPAIDVPAAEHCAMLVDGLVKFDAAQGEAGDLRTVCGTITATYAGSFGLFDNFSGPLVEDMSASAAVQRAYAILIEERARPSVGTRALTESLMKECLILLIRMHLTRLGPRSPLFGTLADSRLTQAVAHVIERPAAPHSVAELAAAAGMSRSAFAKRFGELFGQTPMEFVARTRLHHAAELLRSTDLPVKVIAASMGYASRSHFSRAFRRAYGEDPKNFRKVTSRAAIDPPLGALDAL